MERDVRRQLIWKTRSSEDEMHFPQHRMKQFDLLWSDERTQIRKVYPVAPIFREKVGDMIKELLLANIIRFSTSPKDSRIVVNIKKNGEYVRLCIDYRRVNQLIRLMVYHTSYH